MSRYYRGYYGGRPTYTFIGGGGGIPPSIKALIIANVAVFLLETVLGSWFLLLFGLQPLAVVQSFALWQLVTYMFLHGGVFHILMNMFVLWMFGTELERTWGSREFVRFYFVCGIGAGLLTVLVSPGSGIPVVGASGAIYGLLLAYGLMFPTRIIYLYLLIPMQAKYFVLLIGAVTFYASLSGPGDGIAHMTHLGGMLFGYLYLKAGFSRARRSRGPTLRERYENWRRARLRKKFDVYYTRRQAQRDEDERNRWKN